MAGIAGFLYALSAVLCKKGLETGTGTIRSLVITNLFMSFCFLPYPMLADRGIQIDDFTIGSSLGLLFFLGQFFCFLALRSGDASLITPIMGAKTILVAFFLVLHDLSPNTISWKTWFSAALSAVAIGMLSWPSKKMAKTMKSLVLAFGAAASFALLDSMVPYFTHISDPYNLLFFVFFSVGVYSLVFIPWTEGKLLPFRPGIDLWMWASALPMGIQAILMSLAIGMFKLPTEANVFYACRGLWAVLLIFLIGKSIGITEGKAPPRLIVRRSIGATLLFAGVLLIAF